MLTSVQSICLRNVHLSLYLCLELSHIPWFWLFQAQVSVLRLNHQRYHNWSFLPLGQKTGFIEIKPFIFLRMVSITFFLLCLNILPKRLKTQMIWMAKSSCCLRGNLGFSFRGKTASVSPRHTICRGWQPKTGEFNSWQFPVQYCLPQSRS